LIFALALHFPQYVTAEPKLCVTENFADNDKHCTKCLDLTNYLITDAVKGSNSDNTHKLKLISVHQQILKWF